MCCCWTGFTKSSPVTKSSSYLVCHLQLFIHPHFGSGNNNKRNHLFIIPHGASVLQFALYLTVGVNDIFNHLLCVMFYSYSSQRSNIFYTTLKAEGNLPSLTLWRLDSHKQSGALNLFWGERTRHFGANIQSINIALFSSGFHHSCVINSGAYSTRTKCMWAYAV